MKQAKSDAERARTEMDTASKEAGRQQGLTAAIRRAIEEKLAALLPGTALGEAVGSAREKERLLEDELLVLSEQLGLAAWTWTD